MDAQDLYNLILKLKITEKTDQVKGNRLFRIMALSEFHAYAELRKMNVKPDAIEEIYQLNP
jgi:hypothetical protein